MVSLPIDNVEEVALALGEVEALKKFGEIMGSELGLWCSWTENKGQLYIVTRYVASSGFELV